MLVKVGKEPTGDTESEAKPTLVRSEKVLKSGRGQDSRTGQFSALSGRKACGAWGRGSGPSWKTP